MSVRRAILMSAFTACLACSQTPDLPGTLSTADRAAPFPELVPLDELLNGAPATAQITQASTDTLDSRLANLRARAARLSGPVVDRVTSARMRDGIARAALR